MLRYFFLSLFLVVAAVVSLAGFRGQKSTAPPVQIFPDMKVQPKYVAQHESDFFADGRAARAPVDGTVPIGYAMPGIYSTNAASNSRVAQGVAGFSDATDYFNTGRIGENYGDGFPVEVSGPLLARGQQRFNINCAICHGATGAGNGIVKQLGLATVANLQDARIRTMPDGQIFNTITHGKNTMGAYGSNLTVDDRWAIIAYLRALQRSQNGKLEDAPEAVRNDLQKQTPVTK
jgi:mono/diheme cytochrome c family protein